jgi:hypothetical protein
MEDRAKQTEAFARMLEMMNIPAAERPQVMQGVDLFFDRGWPSNHFTVGYGRPGRGRPRSSYIRGIWQRGQVQGPHGLRRRQEIESKGERVWAFSESSSSAACGFPWQDSGRRQAIRRIVQTFASPPACVLPSSVHRSISLLVVPKARNSGER